MPQTSPKAQVIIYTRPGCRLCDEAKQTIKAAVCLDEYTLEEISIESDADLVRIYQYDIPVITIDSVEAFRHTLTADAFCERLRARQQARLHDLRDDPKMV